MPVVALALLEIITQALLEDAEGEAPLTEEEVEVGAAQEAEASTLL